MDSHHSSYGASKNCSLSLTRASAVSMKKMQKFQPELNKIKEKFKDDRAAQQREMMAFMAKHKINPAKGCLRFAPNPRVL